LASLSIQISEGPEAEDAEVDTSAGRLRRELLELDVDAVERPPASAEPGAKGGGGLTDVLIVTLSNSTALVAMLGVLKDWLKRRQSRTVKITIGEDSLELGQASPADQEKLIASWLDRHGQK
jgi:Effector Associated Constant Component 1